jgi:hypothetical protein
MMSIFGALALHCHYEAEGGALALSGTLPAGHDFERGFSRLKLKIELCPMTEHTAPRAPEVGIV